MEEAIETKVSEGLTPEIPTPEIPKKPPKRWLKIILFSILGLVLVTGLVFAGFFAGLRFERSRLLPLMPLDRSPQVSISISDETANWKTYTNTEYRYSIRYPPDFEVGAKGGADPETFPAPDIHGPKTSSDRLSLIIEARNWGSIPNSPREAFLESYNLSGDWEIISEREDKIAGTAAYRVIYHNPRLNYENGQIQEAIYLLHNKTLYTLIYEETHLNEIKEEKRQMPGYVGIFMINPIKSPQDWRLRDTFDLMLSTFHFLE